MDTSQDKRIRTAAFNWLSEQVAIHGDVLPRALLAQGFIINGSRVPLLGPQGIFKPRVLNDFPLSITTAPGGPYVVPMMMRLDQMDCCNIGIGERILFIGITKVCVKL